MAIFCFGFPVKLVIRQLRLSGAYLLIWYYMGNKLRCNRTRTCLATTKHTVDSAFWPATCKKDTITKKSEQKNGKEWTKEN